MYSIISDYGYGDVSVVESGLSEEQVVSWFHQNRNYSLSCGLNDLPSESDFIYYWVEDYLVPNILK
jgi:hypothetical protein